MKQYVKPTFERIQLCPEETIACFGSPDRDDSRDHTRPRHDFDWEDFWDTVRNKKKKKKH